MGSFFKNFWGVFLFLALISLFYFFIDVPLSQVCKEIPRNWRHIFKFFSSLISPAGHIFLWPLFFISFLIIHRYRYTKLYFLTFYITLSMFVSMTAVRILKWSLGRARPELLQQDIYGFHFFHINHHFHSFPSGHAAAAFTLAASLAIFFPKNKAFFFLAAFFLSLFRILLNYHFAGDVLAGWMIGLYSAASVFKILLYRKNNFKENYFLRI